MYLERGSTLFVYKPALCKYKLEMYFEFANSDIS